MEKDQFPRGDGSSAETAGGPQPAPGAALPPAPSWGTTPATSWGTPPAPPAAPGWGPPPGPPATSWGTRPAPPAAPGWGTPPAPPAAPGWGTPPTLDPGWGAPPPGWSQPLPWTSGYAQPAARSNKRGVLVGLGLALLLAGGVGLGLVFVAGQRSGPTPDAATSAGAVVFSDDFHDWNSGWANEVSTDAAWAFWPGTYKLSAKPAAQTDLFAVSPYREPVQALAVTATESISAEASATSGIGVVCRRGSGDSRVQYEFLLKTSGKWAIDVRTGAGAMLNFPRQVRGGHSGIAAGTTPVSLSARCISLDDGVSTRLILAIDGATVVDMTDTAASLPDFGWIGELEASIGPPSATVTATSFEERDLHR